MCESTRCIFFSVLSLSCVIVRKFLAQTGFPFRQNLLEKKRQLEDPLPRNFRPWLRLKHNLRTDL